MGLFKKRKKQDEDGAKERLTVGQALRKERFKQGNPSLEDVSEQLGEFCVQYENALDAKLEAEQEYEAVLSYLTDIQKLDELAPEQRKEAEELAGSIIRLNEERRPVLSGKKCVGCHLCVLVCPQRAIAPGSKRVTPKAKR